MTTKEEIVLRFAKAMQLARIADYQANYSHPGGILIRPPGEIELKLIHDKLQSVYDLGKVAGENETEGELGKDIKILHEQVLKLKEDYKLIVAEHETLETYHRQLLEQNRDLVRRNDVLLVKLKMKAKNKQKIEDRKKGNK